MNAATAIAAHISDNLVIEHDVIKVMTKCLFTAGGYEDYVFWFGMFP